MKYIFTLITFFIVFSCSIEKSEENNVDLIWEDNFKGSSLDTNFWNMHQCRYPNFGHFGHILAP